MASDPTPEKPEDWLGNLGVPPSPPAGPPKITADTLRGYLDPGKSTDPNKGVPVSKSSDSPHITEISDWLKYHIKRDWPIVMKAPIAFLAVAVFGGLVGWFGTYWIFVPFLNSKFDDLNSHYTTLKDDYEKSEKNLKQVGEQLAASRLIISTIQAKAYEPSQASSTRPQENQISVPDSQRIGVLTQSGQSNIGINNGNVTVVNPAPGIGDRFIKWANSVDPNIWDSIKGHLNLGQVSFRIDIKVHYFSELQSIVDDSHGSITVSDESPAAMWVVAPYGEMKRIVVHIDTSVFAK
jgi:hypothetical protein